MAQPIQITVGAAGLYDPAIGATTCPVSTLAGIEIYVEKSGTGTLPTSAYTVRSGGGFNLSSGSFQSGEIYFIHQTGLQLQTASADYTNGFNYNQVVNALFGRLGWRPSTLADQPTLSTPNTTARSGRYFNDVHALVSVPNIKSIIDNPSMTDNQFNSELESLQRSVILRSLNAVYSEREYIDQVLLFDRHGNNDQPVTNTGLFAGFEIKLAPVIDKAVQIESATLLFDSNKTFTLYLFKDGKKSPVWSQEVTVVANESTVVILEDLILNYISPSTTGGRFYFGYFQDDLGSAKAIQEQVSSYNPTHLFSAQSFYSKATGSDFNRNERSYPSLPYGINLQISSFSDWTATIVKKANLFDELIALTMAYSIIEKVVYSTSSNATERILKDGITMASAIQDLTGSAPVSDGPAPVTGLNKRIEREVLRVKKALFPKSKAQTVNLC